MTEPELIKLGLTIGTIVASVSGGVAVLKSTINGHVKNGDIHMNVDEKKEIAVVSERTDNNEEYISNLRDDIGGLRKDMNNGLDRVVRLIKSGSG